jgi:hypothetical protein
MFAQRRVVAVLALLLFCCCFSIVVVRAERFKEVFVYTPENDDEWQLPCSREKSRMVRGVLNDYIFPHLAVAELNFTFSCPLSRERDLYYEQEANKQKFRASYWKSLYSNKIFKSEYFADQHMENRHMDKIPASADVCLAQYCDPLLCDEHAYRFYDVEDSRRKLRNRFTKRPCYETSMARAQDQCINLLETCFKDFISSKDAAAAAAAAASGGEEADETQKKKKNGNGNSKSLAEMKKAQQHLYTFFKANVCDMLTCRTFHKLIPNLNRKRPNRLRVLYVTFGVVAFLLLLSYYLIVLMTWMERKQKPDLKRRRKTKKDPNKIM